MRQRQLSPASVSMSMFQLCSPSWRQSSSAVRRAPEFSATGLVKTSEAAIGVSRLAG